MTLLKFQVVAWNFNKVFAGNPQRLAEPLWDGEDELAVRNRRGDFPGDVDGGQQRPLLSA